MTPLLLLDQTVFRPCDDPVMEAAMLAVVAFIESPAMGGSRDWPVEMTMELLDDPRTVLPDIGIAPKALLVSATTIRDVAAGSATFVSFEQWLLVRSLLQCHCVYVSGGGGLRRRTRCTGRNDVFRCGVFRSQGVTPPFPAAAVASLLAFVEGDVFRGSRRMPMASAQLALTDDVLETIPGLVRGNIVALRFALRQAKQSAAAASTSISAPPPKTPSATASESPIVTHSGDVVRERVGTGRDSG